MTPLPLLVLEAGSDTKFLTNFANPTLWTLFGSHKEFGGASLLVPHIMEDHKKMILLQIPIEVEVEVAKLHFEVDMEVRMVDIIYMKVNLMEVDEDTLEEKEVEEFVEVAVEVIEVNNQITTQTVTTMENLGTWQKIVIERSMMHEMENYKGIMHQLAIRVMNNCL
jgi:hypothetical protein